MNVFSSSPDPDYRLNSDSAQTETPLPHTKPHPSYPLSPDFPGTPSLSHLVNQKRVRMTQNPKSPLMGNPLTWPSVF